MVSCVEGHGIRGGENVCQYGHPPQDQGETPTAAFGAQAAPGQPDLVSLLQQMVALQLENNQLRQRQGQDRGGAITRKPDRPLIQANSNDNDWAIFIDSWGRYK